MSGSSRSNRKATRTDKKKKQEPQQSNTEMDRPVDNQTTTSSKAILAVDIGTTNLKCSLVDLKLNTISSHCIKLHISQPQEGYSEIGASYLLTTLKGCVEETIRKFKDAYKFECFGLSTQRNSIILWNKETGCTYTDIILWNDRRSADLCDALNRSLSLNMIKRAARLAARFVSYQLLVTAGSFNVENIHVGPKLVFELKRLHEKLSANERCNVVFGTIETWLVWTLSRERTFGVDITCASSTGLYDIYNRGWSGIMLFLLQIPRNILPTVCDTCHNYGHIKSDEFGLNYELPITALVGDSQASLIAECAFNVGDCVISLGTGSFISVNVGNRPLASSHGAYPLCNLKHGNSEIYIIHSPVAASGISIEWAKSFGLFSTFDEMENTLRSVNNSDGVYFVPAFGMLEVTGHDKTSVGTGFIGLRACTSLAHMLRAVVDSIAFSIKFSMDSIQKDLRRHNIKLRSVRVSGGVSHSNFLCQHIANLLETKVERSSLSYTSSMHGAAFLAGMGANLFDSLDDLSKVRQTMSVFEPAKDCAHLFERDLTQWKRALQRFTDWYKRD